LGAGGRWFESNCPLDGGAYALTQQGGLVLRRTCRQNAVQNDDWQPREDTRRTLQARRRRNKSEYDTLTGRGAPGRARSLYRSVRRSPFNGSDRRSIYEAAALGVSALKNGHWVDAVAPGTALEIEVREPATG
jgi:hypothetical protein